MNIKPIVARANDFTPILRVDAFHEIISSSSVIVVEAVSFLYTSKGCRNWQTRELT
jgi:hypothetical protein